MPDYREWHTVRSHLEEEACANCGAPMYVGDKLLSDDRTGRVYCSTKCSDQHRVALDEVGRD